VFKYIVSIEADPTALVAAAYQRDETVVRQNGSPRRMRFEIVGESDSIVGVIEDVASSIEEASRTFGPDARSGDDLTVEIYGHFNDYELSIPDRLIWTPGTAAADNLTASLRAHIGGMLLDAART
jgi:hypothetical protein